MGKRKTSIVQRPSNNIYWNHFFKQTKHNIMGLFDRLKKFAEKVQQRNEANPKVETADKSVFENIQNSLDELQNKHGDYDECTPQEMEEVCEEIQEKVVEVQQKNEADPGVPTADKTVFDEFGDMLNQYKTGGSPTFEPPVAEVPTPEVYEIPKPNFDDISTPTASSADNRIVAITDTGGSLEFRTEPDFGAPTYSNRVPDRSRIFVLRYSDHSINLDGKTCRWAQIEHDGQVGWVLENYLNFN